MRRLFGLLLATGVPISIGYAVACGPPSSFDNLTGGVPDGGLDVEAAAPPLQEDPTLPAPRPMAPLAGSWINGSRPRFRWEIAEKGGTGARVVVCPDAACADASKNKEWTVRSGDEVQADVDLPPGRYFWHLVSTNATSFGTLRSPTWSMIVRGGAGDGTPGGTISDQNGDGIADLFVTVDFMDTGVPFHEALLLMGRSADDPLAFVTGIDESALGPRSYEVATTGVAIATGDFDGDGIGDAAFADQDFGGAGKVAVLAFKGGRDLDYGASLGTPVIPGLDAIPSLSANGDFDGDGRADLLVGAKTFSVGVFGSGAGLAELTFLSQMISATDVDAGDIITPTKPMPIAGADLDNDGKIDVAIPIYLRGYTFFVKQAKGDGRSVVVGEFAPGQDAGASLSPASAFAFGDVDADGLNDVGFVTTRDAKTVVCILTHKAAGVPVCWAPDAPPSGFGSSLIAADLEGDGKDELLVGSTSGGVDVLSLPTADKIVAEHLALDHGATMTVIDPGRPKPAAWAATRADGTSVALFSGKEQKRLLSLEEMVFTPQITPVRFQSAIR